LRRTQPGVSLISPRRITTSTRSKISLSSF
jgi:hypothetical protein